MFLSVSVIKPRHSSSVYLVVMLAVGVPSSALVEGWAILTQSAGGLEGKKRERLTPFVVLLHMRHGHSRLGSSVALHCVTLGSA